jgi:hypothetical protein
MTIQEIIEIYALYGIVVSDAEAAADLKHATGDTPDEQKLENRIHGYAKQVALEQYAEGREAEEFESNYQ